MLQALYRRVTGKANKVTPAEEDEMPPSSSSESTASEKREKGFWSDSEYSSRTGSSRGSSRIGDKPGVLDQGFDTVENPLLVAFGQGSGSGEGSEVPKAPFIASPKQLSNSISCEEHSPGGSTKKTM